MLRYRGECFSLRTFQPSFVLCLQHCLVPSWSSVQKDQVDHFTHHCSFRAAQAADVWQNSSQLSCLFRSFLWHQPKVIAERLFWTKAHAQVFHRSLRWCLRSPTTLLYLLPWASQGHRWNLSPISRLISTLRTQSRWLDFWFFTFGWAIPHIVVMSMILTEYCGMFHSPIFSVILPQLDTLKAFFTSSVSNTSNLFSISSQAWQTSWRAWVVDRPLRKPYWYSTSAPLSSTSMTSLFLTKASYVLLSVLTRHRGFSELTP